MFTSLVRGKEASEGGNKVSLHVTLLLAGTGPGVGTLVPGVLVSTHPRGEELGRRGLVFIGASVGLSEGIKDEVFGDLVEVLVKRGLEEGRDSDGSE